MSIQKTLAFIFSFITFNLCSTSSNSAENTEEKPKGRLYILWGYNKDWFSRSDLHFESVSNNDFNFTIYDVSAHDLPRFEKAFNKDISIPQFIYRIGYSFARHPKIGIEIGFDHAKYIMTKNQIAHVKGKIHENYIDKDTILSEKFVRFEHTNGANFLMLSLVYKNEFYHSVSGSNVFSYTLKPGAGIVIPQSEVALFNVNQNNNYHVAGYVSGLDLGIHYQFRKHLIAETGFKGVFANYLDVLSVGDSKANHNFFCLEWLFSIGYQIAL
jgi:hypothetical protein